MNDNESRGNLDETINAVSNLMEKVPIYEDAVQPVARQTGKALETVGRTVNVALMPLRGMVWGMEQFEEFIHSRLSEKLKNVDTESISTPDPTIAGPALEALKFAGNEATLRDMYANLLANAMDEDTKGNVHPSFVEIIKQLKPREAMLLESLAKVEKFPNVCHYYQQHNIRGGWGFSEEVDTSNIKGTFVAEYEHMIPDLDINTAFDNLCRLQLLQVNNKTSHKLQDNFHRGSFSEKIIDQIEISITQEDTLIFTSLGVFFIETCVKNKI